MGIADPAEIMAVQNRYVDWRREYPEAYFALVDVLKDHGGYSESYESAQEIMEQLTLLLVIDPEGRR